MELEFLTGYLGTAAIVSVARLGFSFEEARHIKIQYIF
jgi:hypothetical protein